MPETRYCQPVYENVGIPAKVAAEFIGLIVHLFTIEERDIMDFWFASIVD